MRPLCLSLLLCLGVAAPAAADAIPGDDECGPGQHWEGGHDGECSCAASPGRGSSGGPLALLFGVACVAVSRRR